MEERLPLMKRMDVFLFKKLDTFRSTPAHSKMVEFYAGLEEGEQHLFKSGLLAALFILPLFFIGLMWWGNSRLSADLEGRRQLVMRMQDIVAQNNDANNLAATMAAPQGFTDQTELTGRLSSLLASAGVDASKLRLNNFSSSPVGNLMRSEADFRFDGLSTDQLVNLLTALLSQERFRISAASIRRNSSSNLLDGTFHGVHYGQNAPALEE